MVRYLWRLVMVGVEDWSHNEQRKRSEAELELKTTNPCRLIPPGLCTVGMGGVTASFSKSEHVYFINEQAHLLKVRQREQRAGRRGVANSGQH